MEENSSKPDEINRKTKRKSQNENPTPHRICNNDSSKKAKKVENDQNFGRDDALESGPESAKDSNSIHTNQDSDEANTTDTEYPEICAAILMDEPSNSSLSWSDTTSSSSDKYCRYSPDITNSLSLEKSPIDCSCLGCRNDQDLLYSNAVGSGDYVLSSGRWTVSRGRHVEEGKKLTIDKEFEQHFSMLML